MTAPTPTRYSLIQKTPDWVAVNKPHGLLVHKTFIDRQDPDNLLKQLREDLSKDLNKDLNQTIHPVHRLDKPTSGVMIFALNKHTAQHLSEQFAQHAVQKTYLAIVRGWPEDKGVIDHPLKKIEDKHDDPRRNKNTEPQSAITHFECLAKTEIPFAVDKYPSSRYALLKLTPQTGRQHQIRRHLKHISHPIIGDVRYGKGTHNRFFKNQFGVGRLLLHAHSLTFDDEQGHQQNMIAPLDEKITQLINTYLEPLKTDTLFKSEDTP